MSTHDQPLLAHSTSLTASGLGCHNVTRLKVRRRATKVSCDHGEKFGGSRVGCGGTFTVLLEATVRVDCRDMLEVLRPCSEVESDAVDAPERMRFAAGSASVT